jgi:hypothetical protein
MSGMTLSDADLEFVLAVLRSSDRPIATEELIQALRERIAK